MSVESNLSVILNITRDGMLDIFGCFDTATVFGISVSVLIGIFIFMNVIGGIYLFLRRR